MQPGCCARRLVRQLYGVSCDLEEAEDAVQEAFVRALARPAAFRRLDNHEAWLRTVALNQLRSRWRRLKRQRLLRDRLAETAGHEPELSPDHVALVTALQALPAAQREAIALHHLGDLSVAEVAATLGVPTGTVKARLSRGRSALAGLLADTTNEAGTSHA